MARDYYAESQRIAEELRAYGDIESATAITDAIERGATGSESLFGLRPEFAKILARDVPEPLRSEVSELRRAIDDALND